LHCLDFSDYFGQIAHWELVDLEPEIILSFPFILEIS
jgi:hypothetical protein